MLHHGSTYRSPFNGPRWGAVLAMIVILFGQVASAFHDPSLNSEHADAGEQCVEYPRDTAEHDACGSSVEEGPIESCEDGDCNDRGCEDGDCNDRGCEDCSDCGECEQECTHCCHHVPMSSPLPALHASLQHGAFPIALPAHPFILAADITPPFHPPRG